MGGGRRDSEYEPETLRRLEERARESIRQANEVRRNVFISHSFDDMDAINALRGQAANDQTDLNFNDRSLKVAFDSDDAEYIRRGLREKIRNCSVTFVYLTEAAATSRWVDWEIRESVRQGKRVVGLFAGDAPPSVLPRALVDADAPVVQWTHENIMRELA